MNVLFVCTGNICRSPTAEGVMIKQVREAGLADDLWIDSAGTMAYHIGEEPDPRAQSTAERRGYDLSRLQARLLEPHDFQNFDLILAMDKGHLRVMRRMMRDVPGTLGKAELKLFLDYAEGQKGQDVPDPYYGGRQDFETALDLIEMGVEGLIKDLRPRFD
ncbi:MAG: low molecular weight protein-tyrosine-phosphatase [Pseudomonadota bacterium]